MTVVPSFDPSGRGELLMVGNTLVTSRKRNPSPSGNLMNPSSAFDQVIINQSKPQIAPTIRDLHLSRDLTDSTSSPNLSNSNSKKFKPQDLLAQNTYNELSSRIAAKQKSSLSFQGDPNTLLNQNTTPITNYGPMTVNSGNVQNPPVLPNQSSATPQKIKMEPQIDLQSMSNVAHNYLDKQNQLMAKILKDAEDFKKMDEIKQKMLSDQELYRMSGLGYGGVFSPAPPSIGYFPPVANPNILLYPQYSLPTYPPGYPVGYPTGYPPMIPTVYPPNTYPNQEFHQGFNKSNSRASSRDTGEDKMPLSRRKAPAKANRSQGRKLLRSIGWTMALPGLWFIATVKWAEKRRELQLKIFEEEIPETLEIFIEFASGVIEKEMKNLFNDKNSLAIVSRPGTTIKPTDMEKRCACITEHIVLIIDGISVKLDSSKFAPKFFQTLANLSEDDAVIPQSFLSGFEIKRLSFNMFGNLKNMNEWKSKMILAAFILIKGLIYFMIMKPWTVIPAIQQKNLNMKNLINLGSVFYHAIIDVLIENVPQIKNFDSQLPFKASVPTFAALEPKVFKDLDVIPDGNDDDDQEIVSGFYSRDQVRPLLDERPAMAREIKDAINDFLEMLYDLTHKAYKKKEHVKELFADHRPY